MIDSLEEEPPECRQCGWSVEPSSERRVVTTVGDGAAVHRHFCSDECLECWESAKSD
ncbi:hypothetical protein BDK88_2536 [Natrinema hispanicum]|uniref:TRASH domain-containing protein n=1 Tax=Natrinema hispanicum TaxID=392421 RepID=A0A482YAG8_9EURY|nr:hypothetical protein BDK88_2536 [Natrinema hispanicum]